MVFLNPIGATIHHRLPTIIVPGKREHDRGWDAELLAGLVKQKIGAARRAADPAHRSRCLCLLRLQLLAQPALCLSDRLVRVGKARRLAARCIGAVSGADDDAVAVRQAWQRRSGCQRTRAKSRQIWPLNANWIGRNAEPLKRGLAPL